MHILAEQIRSLDETVQAVDLGQTPGDVVFLSFTDSDLALAAAVQEALLCEADRPVPAAAVPPSPTAAEPATLRATADQQPAAAVPPSLRLASLAALRHPYSVDRYLEAVAGNARFILVRCLGGMDYWRYGIDELHALARSRGIHLAVVPGDAAEDPRLDAASTLPVADLRRIWQWFQAGGPENMRSLLGWIATRLGAPLPWREPEPLPAFGCLASACGCGGICRLKNTLAGSETLTRIAVVFYRSLLSAGDTAPVSALCDALRRRGMIAQPLFVTSLKDPAAAEALAEALDAFAPDVILNTTAFSARQGDGGSVLDRADCPVLQVPIATTFREAWAASSRGLSAADLAMNYVLPEVDGRLSGPVLSFKADGVRSEATEFTRVLHCPETSGIENAADLAARWARLRHLPPADRRLAVVLSDYPVKGGRTGYAVGLDGPASLVAIADLLREAGHDLPPLPSAADLIARLEDASEATVTYDLDDYTEAFSRLHHDYTATVVARWGPPAAAGGVFSFRAMTCGKIVLAVQPDRGPRASREADHHDPNLPPPHQYIAFYLWLSRIAGIDAMIHLGTHGTLEWLPGKAVALSPACAPAVLTANIPVIYPFIVNNPGEAAQAKRRIGALTLGHLTPPLRTAGTHGATAEIEALLDEFASAQSLDPRRAGRLASAILEKAAESGLGAESGLTPDLGEAEALARLDAFICDLKDMRIGDGLHVFGRAPEPAAVAATAEAFGVDPVGLAVRLEASAAGERDNLLAALSGRFVPSGPAGAPSARRLDVLPTGRNLYAVDPRSIPTRTAYEIGARVAEEVVARYTTEHGDWPRSVVVDLWGSATMRTGGDDFAQALALLGVRPVWDTVSSRVSGFEILSTARTGRPRVDVTLRVSGLFRDVFATQIALFDEAARAVAALDEDAETNPLAGADPTAIRVFGTAPGAYGVGIVGDVHRDDWQDRAALGERYLDASGFGYGVGKEGVAASDAFRDRVAAADLFVHVQDMAGQDLLDSDAFADHEGGFAAAAAAAGAAPALFHVDTTGDAPKVRTLAEEVARVVRGRATNPRWIASQMRHGHRGAAEIAETVGNLVALAATTDAVAQHQFEALFEATLGDDAVRSFLVNANPEAAASAARLFDQALRRGLWATRRNSVAGRIAETLGRAEETGR